MFLLWGPHPCHAMCIKMCSGEKWMNVCQTKTQQEKGYSNKLALLWGEAQLCLTYVRLKKRKENTELPNTMPMLSWDEV